MTSLNPLFTIENQLAETIATNRKYKRVTIAREFFSTILVPMLFEYLINRVPYAR